jgi:hypothetical protein
MVDTPRPGFPPPGFLVLGQNLAPFLGGPPPMICSFPGFSPDLPESLNLRFSHSLMKLIFCILELPAVQEPFAGLHLGVWLHEPLQGGILELVGPVLSIMEVGSGSGH